MGKKSLDSFKMNNLHQNLNRLKNGWNKEIGATKLIRVCMALEMDLNVLKQLIVDED